MVKVLTSPKNNGTDLDDFAKDIMDSMPGVFSVSSILRAVKIVILCSKEKDPSILERLSALPNVKYAEWDAEVHMC
ncbi:hypothetical protein GNI_101780 [Gregarina niphandrodes]|uniref:Uncharacterized protein n=1 Tax=Gregarina niphandrodes TaxID=110365 RepID=A0A023B4G3_GRENI|nr:hypothetical protein GNI_101780 [Gregarina niphandrodes]EZG56719.1 hypothetical protein GNI_101780 [Gregarina niphandrodes]|eukprot:XP_011131187.1 hypothetical protein GNI_101780 [Gregarina niphandrodes]